MNSQLKKSTLVLNRKDTDGRFTDGHGRVGLILSNQDWDDMGKPVTITVTIEPGDTLN